MTVCCGFSKNAKARKVREVKPEKSVFSSACLVACPTRAVLNGITGANFLGEHVMALVGWVGEWVGYLTGSGCGLLVAC